jgi:hypothetical protein
MNSAPRIETVEISEAELDNVSGGLEPHAGVQVGPTVITDSDLMAQLDAVKSQLQGAAGQLQGAAGQYHAVGVGVTF